MSTGRHDGGSYAAAVALLIDTPRWPAHGRLWAHLISDSSLPELHAFAASVGIPRRSFEGDHYDVPAERHPDVVAAGARLVDGRDLVRALQRSGLRLPKRKGERVLGTWDDPDWPAGAGPHQVDCVRSALAPPTTTASWLITLDDEGRLALDGDRLPGVHHRQPEAPRHRRLGYLRVRPTPSGRPAAWSHVALVQHAGGLQRVRWVPLAQVAGVEAQPYWWPLVEAVAGAQ